MSKRFGRQQKKALLAKIAEMEKTAGVLITAKNQYQSESEDLRNDVVSLNKTLQRTAHVLGEHFISLPVKNVNVDAILDYYRYNLPSQQTPLRYSAERPTMEFVERSLRILETHRVETNLSALRQALHMNYVSKSGHVTYGLSTDVWLGTPEKVLIEMIKEDIAPKIAQAFVQQRIAYAKSTGTVYLG